MPDTDVGYVPICGDKEHRHDGPCALYASTPQPFPEITKRSFFQVHCPIDGCAWYTRYEGGKQRDLAIALYVEHLGEAHDVRAEFDARRIGRGSSVGLTEPLPPGWSREQRRA